MDLKLGVGIDIESIKRFKKLDLKKDKIFLNRIYTVAELHYCYSKKNHHQHLAVRYAAKEAVFKALTQINNKSPKIELNEIEILNVPPIANIKNRIYKKFNIRISLSHSKDAAIAIAVIY